MATLKSLVDETSNIKNELKSCYVNLKKNLIEKGVNVSSSDKMPNLISKVGSIETAPTYTAGDNKLLYYMDNRQTNIAMTVKVEETDNTYFFKYQCDFNGSARVFITAGEEPAICPYVSFKLIKSSGETLVVKKIQMTTQLKNYTVDINNIEVGDYIALNVYKYEPNYSYGTRVSCIKITVA